MSNTIHSYKGRQYYYLKNGEKEEFKTFEHYYPQNPPSWEHVTDPYTKKGSCKNCFSSSYVYGMNFLPYFPSPPEMYQKPNYKECSGCYSSSGDYGTKFGRTFEKYWTCSNPSGCVQKRTEGALGVI